MWRKQSPHGDQPFPNGVLLSGALALGSVHGGWGVVMWSHFREPLRSRRLMGERPHTRRAQEAAGRVPLSSC